MNQNTYVVMDINTLGNMKKQMKDNNINVW